VKNVDGNASFLRRIARPGYGDQAVEEVGGARRLQHHFVFVFAFVRLYFFSLV